MTDETHAVDDLDGWRCACGRADLPDVTHSQARCAGAETMSDARTWLERHTEAHLRPTMDALFMRDALLAVLDECDEPGGEADALALASGSGAYPGIWYDALALASGRIHAAIDKALGVSDG